MAKGTAGRTTYGRPRLGPAGFEAAWFGRAPLGGERRPRVESVHVPTDVWARRRRVPTGGLRDHGTASQFGYAQVTAGDPLRLDVETPVHHAGMQGAGVREGPRLVRGKPDHHGLTRS